MTPCILVQTGNYTQTLVLKAIPALPDHFEFRIESQLATARNPSDLHVLHRTIVTVAALRELQNEVAEVLRVADSQLELSTTDRHSFWEMK